MARRIVARVESAIFGRFESEFETYSVYWKLQLFPNEMDFGLEVKRLKELCISLSNVCENCGVFCLSVYAFVFIEFVMLYRRYCDYDEEAREVVKSAVVRK
ncbi:hypothetical protein SUGI_1204520 [Cryptomeria japonica]|nr:hypothetical protein SUGI_1204520 [Cryptomeria japonica]